MIRRVAAGLLFAALLAGGIRTPVLRLLLPPHRPPDVPGPAGGVDRKPLRLANDSVPRDVLQFFEEVRGHTRKGQRVAFLMAWPHEGWSYAYWRASYVLAGRHVVAPLDVAEPETLPDVVALWQKGWGHPRYEVVWADDRSAILRLRR